MTVEEEVLDRVGPVVGISGQERVAGVGVEGVADEGRDLRLICQRMLSHIFSKAGQSVRDGQVSGQSVFLIIVLHGKALGDGVPVAVHAGPVEADRVLPREKGPGEEEARVHVGGGSVRFVGGKVDGQGRPGNLRTGRTAQTQICDGQILRHVRACRRRIVTVRQLRDRTVPAGHEVQLSQQGPLIDLAPVEVKLAHRHVVRFAHRRRVKRHAEIVLPIALAIRRHRHLVIGHVLIEIVKGHIFVGIRSMEKLGEAGSRHLVQAGIDPGQDAQELLTGKNPGPFRHLPPEVLLGI